MIDGNRVTFTGTGRYEKEGVDTLTIQLAETAVLDEGGRILSLEDVYPEGQEEMLGWLERYSAEFDPSYV